MFDYTQLFSIIDGVLQDDPIGPAFHAATQEFLGKYNAYLTPSLVRFYYFFNPYEDSEPNWRQVFGTAHYASGQGILNARSGWTDQDSFLGLHFSTYGEVDHTVPYFGDFQLYRKGEWALTHPIGYAPPPLADNNMVIAGFGSSVESRGPVAQESAADGSYQYMVGTTAGSIIRNNFYQPPPAFLHEHTRSILYLPSSDRSSDVLVVYDRVNAEDPRDLPSYSRYPAATQTAIESEPGLKEWVIHTPVTPTIADNKITWQTAAGQHVKVDALLPVDRQIQVDNAEQVLTTGYWIDGDRKQMVRLWPATKRLWDTFLNVVSVADQADAVTSSTVTSAAGNAEGALVHRAGQDDVLAMFSAVPGEKLVTNILNSLLVHDPQLYRGVASARLLTQGYTINFTTNTANTRVYLTDLLPNAQAQILFKKQWFVTVDGTTTSLDLSDQGIGRINVAGQGNHTLTVFPTAVYSIQGQIVLNGSPLSGVTVKAGGKTSMTDANGRYVLSGFPLFDTSLMTVTAEKAGYTFAPLQDTSVSPSSIGLNSTVEVNFSSDPVSIPQLVKFARYLVDLQNLTGDEISVADADGDGTVTVGDLILIMKGLLLAP
jgi:hypothetical protein